MSSNFNPDNEPSNLSFSLEPENPDAEAGVGKVSYPLPPAKAETLIEQSQREQQLITASNADNLLEWFLLNSTTAHDVAALLVHQQATEVTRQLLDIQRRLDEDHVVGVSPEEQASIQAKAVRAKRMSQLLRQIHESNRLLFQEFMACATTSNSSSQEEERHNHELEELHG
jgi:hypothetical protein